MNFDFIRISTNAQIALGLALIVLLLAWIAFSKHPSKKNHR